ncbi:MAG: hypothetical protein U1E29_11675 [Coriobacteriia bacterium]|nr:hypothetical protein [Coriobacteriia bacterium]
MSNEQAVLWLRSVLSWSDVVALVAVAAGAFLGTFSAYLLESRRRERVESADRYSALVKTQLALGMQLNSLAVIDRQYLDPVRELEDRHMRLVPAHINTTELRVDLPSIAFVAEVDEAEILQRLMLAEESFMTAVEALRLTSERIEQSRYQGAIARGPINPETGEAEAIFDPVAITILKALVDGLYESVEHAIGQQRASLEEVRALMKRLFPSRDALSFELPE